MTGTAGDELAVSGYAGTGKTTLLGVTFGRLMKKRPNRAIAFCAPTGKAAGVLRKKLEDFDAINPAVSRVGTVHSLLYRPLKSNEGDDPVFRVRSDMLPYSLVVVDEASMLTESVRQDILSFGVPVLYVGDEGQLPPVNDVPFKPLRETPYKLVDVLRQALENPIVRWATTVRNGGELPENIVTEKFATFPRNDDRARSLVRKAIMEKIPDGSYALLCGTNRTRMELNVYARSLLGHNGVLPHKGEKLICLRNYRGLGLTNGDICTVVEASQYGNGCYLVQFEEHPWPMLAFSGALMSRDMKEVLDRLRSANAVVRTALLGFDDGRQKDVAVFDYGYACSVHKAQGSEWPGVLLFDERNRYMTEEDHRRWLYTGMTRAGDKLCVLH